MAKATGELAEYMLRAKAFSPYTEVRDPNPERQAGSAHFTTVESAQLNSQDAREWLAGLKSYTRRWVDEHKDGGADHWTVAPAIASTAPAMPARCSLLAADERE